ncbi:MAG: O-succinylbenzoate synthase, partial [Aeromicrobium sp.]
MQFRTFAIDMPTRFRGISRREGMVVHGPAGWAEFSPFLDYDAAQCVPWLAAALDSAERVWPAPVRQQVAVNCTVPAVGPDQAADIVNRSG